MQLKFFRNFKLMLESLVPHFILKIYELKILLFCPKIFRVFLWGFPALTLIPSMHKEKWTKKGTQLRDNNATMENDVTPCDDDATMQRWCDDHLTTRQWFNDVTKMWHHVTTTQQWYDDATIMRWRNFDVTTMRRLGDYQINNCV